MSNKKKNKKSKNRSLKKNFKIFLGKMIVAMIFFGSLYLFFLYQSVSTKFDRHRWNLPSRVYSDSFPLYPGRSLESSQLKEKLEHLGYIEVSEKPSNSGRYQILKDRFSIYLRNFDYPDEKFKGYLLEVILHENKIKEIIKHPEQTSLDYTKIEPELISSIFDNKIENRTYVPLNKVPPHLIKSIVAIEDHRFYSHFGIDIIGILRAAIKNIAAWRIVEGGSTLTQQLIKNYYLHSEKSFLRKFNEAIMAIFMELEFSKEEILEGYINEIYLGQKGNISIAGVQEASKHYFSKDIEQLNLAESAGLTGLIRSPGLYNPFTQTKSFIKRRNLILAKLREGQIISEQDYLEAIRTNAPPKKHNTPKSSAPYFINYVKKEISDKFPVETLKKEGLRIFTTLEMNDQRLAEKSLNSHLKYLENNLENLKLEKQSGHRIQSALIALQPHTGFIRAYVGGRNFSQNQLDHISQIKRQPGSAFKPFVYLTALNPKIENHITLSSLLDDSELKLEDFEGKVWEPQNYSKKFHGMVRAREALEKSYNIATIRLALEIGLDRIIETAHLAGIESPLKPYPSLALGSFEVSPIELIQAYSIFPNQGFKTKALAVKKIVTPEGEVLENKKLKFKKVFNPDTIYLMNKLMTGVMEQGTGRLAKNYGVNFLSAGKTGTTSDNRDAWFVGYTPELLALSWVGFDNNQTTGLTGSSGALPIWAKFMSSNLKEKSYYDFGSDKNIIKIKIDEKTGLKYKSNCGRSTTEFFIKGTEPNKKCR